MIVFHIVEASTWEAAKAVGKYRPASLENEEFIHFSTVEQVVATANRFYKGQDGLVLLEVSCDRLTEPLCYEDVPGYGIFPHLYAPLPVSAVLKVWPFPHNADGAFSLPFSQR
ncbi:MAG: DUF952 domain-containing protein [Cyanobacteria bacterium J06627_28]